MNALTRLVLALLLGLLISAAPLSAHERELPLREAEAGQVLAPIVVPAGDRVVSVPGVQISVVGGDFERRHGVIIFRGHPGVRHRHGTGHSIGHDTVRFGTTPGMSHRLHRDGKTHRVWSTSSRHSDVQRMGVTPHGFDRERHQSQRFGVDFRSPPRWGNVHGTHSRGTVVIWPQERLSIGGARIEHRVWPGHSSKWRPHGRKWDHGMRPHRFGGHRRAPLLGPDKRHSRGALIR